MHPSISLMLRDPRTRRAIERALASRGRHGDTMIAHINPAEALALKRMGGAGTINPWTGLRQFWEDGGGAGNSAGHADPGHSGANGGGGNPGGNGGYNGQGRGWGGVGDGTMGGDLGPGETRSGESAFNAAANDYNGNFWGHVFGAKPDLADSASYADGTWHTGGSLPGAIAGLVAGAFTPPGVGTLLGQGVGALARAMGIHDTVIGGPGAPASEGMMKGLGIGGAPIGSLAGGSAAGGGPGSSGQNGGGRGGDPRGQMAMPGVPSGTQPAPAVAPAGLPPAANPALAGLYYGGMTADPFAGRFGINPGLLPYLIAAGQPQGGGFLSGMLR